MNTAFDRQPSFVKKAVHLLVPELDNRTGKGIKKDNRRYLFFVNPTNASKRE